MKKVSRIITAILLLLMVLLSVSCDHNVYMYDNTDNMWYVNGSFFSTMQAAFDYIYQMVMGSRSIDDVPGERTAVLLRDVTDGERGGGLTVPSDFSGMLTIDFGGHTYEFDDSLDHFFEILGGDEVYITNGTTVIYNEASHEPFAIAINTDTLTIDSHLIDDRRVDPIDSTKSDAKLFDVGEKGRLVVKDVPEQEGASLNGVISVVTDGTTGGMLLLNGSRVVITNILTRYKDADGNIYDTIPAETAIPTDARSVIDILRGYVTILAIETPSDYRNGDTLYEKAILNIIKGDPTQDTKVDNPHTIDAVIEAIVNLPKSAGVDHAVRHEYAPEWYTDATHHWHECTICGHKDDDYGEHTFTEWEEEAGTLDWVRHCTVCSKEQRETHVHTLTKVEAKDPTCTVDGNIEHWLCTHTGCGKLFLDSDAIEEVTAEQVSIPATGHDWSEEWSHDEEHHWHDCLNGCGEKADVADHSFSDWTYDSTDDRDHRTCDLCGQEESRNHVHELSHIEALEETCTDDGNTEYWHCMICGRYYSDQECTTEITLEDTVIPAKGHSWNEGWTYDDDHHWHVCDNNCGEKDGVADHVWSDWAYDEDLKALVRICSICGAKDIEGHEHSSDTWVTIDPINHWKVCSCGTTFATAAHTFTDWTYDSELDKDTRECTVCGRTETRNHVHGTEEAGTLIHTPGVDSTCTEKGNEEYWYCNLCERYYLDADCTIETTLDGTVIPAKGHEMGNWEVTTEPTCTEKGEETRYCQRCDYYETRDVDATGHSVETIARLEPTCTEDGNILYYHCTNCDCYFFDEDCTQEIDKAKLDFPAEEGGVVLEALGHIVKYVYNDDEHMAYCERCSEVLLDWHPHHWDDGVPCEDGQHIIYTCTVCGAIRNATLPEFETYYVSIGVLRIPTLPSSPCGEMEVTREGNVYKVRFVPHLNSNTDYEINCRYLYNGVWSDYLPKQTDEKGDYFTFTATGSSRWDYYIVMQIYNEGGTITRTMYVNNTRPIGK